MEAIDGFRCNIHGCIESESHIRSPDIIVDGLGYTNHIQSQLREEVGGLLCPITSDADQTIQSQLPVVLQDDLGLFLIARRQHFPEGFFPGSSQDGTAQMEDTRQTSFVELFDILIQKADKAAMDTDHLHTVIIQSGFADTAYGCIDAWTISARRKYSYSHRTILLSPIKVDIILE